MNFKLNALIAAALLASGSAHAITATDDMTGGNAYLLLTVLDVDYNSGVGRSYTRSLEVAMNDFGTQNRSTGGFTTNVDSLGNQTWTTSTLWSQFTAGMSAAAIAGLQWDVTALDQVGTSAADQKRILTTSTTDLLDLQSAPNVQVSNAEVNNATLNQDVYWDAVIATMGSGTEIIVTDPDSNAFAIGFGKHASNLGGQIQDFNTMGQVGDSMGFYYLTRSSSTNTAEALAVAYGNANGASTFTLGLDGELVFANAAPVPEASTYGMMLAGLGLVGFMARRRINGRA